MSPLNRRSARIAVAGAGPVGLAAGALLADAGYAVTLIGPVARTADERTAALLAGSTALLRRIGVWGELAPQSAPLKTLRIIDGTRRLIRAPEVTFTASEIDLDAFGHNIPNAALVAALEAAVAERGVERVEDFVSDVVAERSAIVLRLATGADVTAELAVAADGRRSKVRQGAGIAVSDWRYDQAALVCNLRHQQPHHDTATEFHTEVGPFTLVPLPGPGNRTSLVWVDRPGAVERRLHLDDFALAAEIEERSAAILGRITLDGPRQAFPLSGLTARRFAADRVALAGEAAHVFPPIGAQGLNLGYRDLVELAEALEGPLADPGDETVLAAYDRARRADVVSRTVAVDALNRTLLSDFLPVQGFRSLGLFLLDRIPPLRRLVMRQGVAAD